MQQITFQELPERRFGVELEVSNNLSKDQIWQAVYDFESSQFTFKEVKATAGPEGWSQTNDNSYWHVKFDRTCGPKGKPYDSGWEIASYIGSGSYDVSHISKVAQAVKNAGAETNLNCGFHVHVETKDFSINNMATLMARWLKIEDLLMSICHNSRRNNIHCVALRKKYSDVLSSYNRAIPEWLWYAISPIDLNIHNNNDKRVTLNTVGYASYMLDKKFRRPTVELRLPECLLEESHVKNWVCLILNIIESAKHASDAPENLNPAKDLNEALRYLGLSGGENFFVFDEYLLNTKIWFLNKIISVSDNTEMVDQAKKLLEFITLI